MAHACDSSIWEAEEAGSLWVQGQPAAHNEFKASMNHHIKTLGQKTKQKIPQGLLEFMSKFCNVERWNINTEEWTVLLYINNELTKKHIRKTLPFSVASRKIKQRRINPNPEGKRFYNESHRILQKKFKKNIQN